MADNSTILNKAVIATPNTNSKVVDLSSEINLIPRTWGLVGAMNVFGEEFGTQKTFFVPMRDQVEASLLEDRNWKDTRPTQLRRGSSGITYKIPHFPIDDAILPADLDGNIVPQQIVAGTQLESVARLRVDKMERLRAKHSRTHEYARTYALVTGSVYAPHGTLRTSYGSTINVYNEWGITRQSFAISVGAGVNPLPSVDALYAALQAQAKEGDPLAGYVVLCSPEMFSALTRNDYIGEIYRTAFQFPQAREVLVGRLGNTMGFDARYRSFEYGGIIFLEYAGTVGGNRAIPANQGVAFPMGMELGRLHFAPAEKFSSINQTAQASYFWEYMGEKDDIIEIMTETNFAAVLRRPDLVMTVTLNTDPA